MADGTEPIDPDEIIYRRVFAKGNIYKAGRIPPLSQKAFSPRDVDTDGLSIIRNKYVTGPEEAAAYGAEGHDYFVIAFRAADLRDAGMQLVPDPKDDCAGHSLIANVHAANRDLPETQAMMDRARSKPFQAFGPFPGKKKLA